MTHSTLRFAVALALGLAPVVARADAPAADPPEQLGTVDFANSCDASVQPTLTRAVALLHSFWWAEGGKAFRAVLERDPSCAIATWGIAAIDIDNPFAAGPTPAKAQEAQAAIARGRVIGAKTERERGYIDAVAAYYDHYADLPHRGRVKALSDAFQNLAARFPDDETQIFSALYLTATQDPADKSFATTLKAAAILEQQFAKHPDHPGVAHYLIHSYDYPAIADKGVAAALCYADIAPSAAHALHMPSHIFTRVGAWKESVATNLRSTAVSVQQHESNGQLHAMDYMTYADLQLGRDDDARGIVAAVPKLVGWQPAAPAAPYALAAIPARYVVERGAWSEARLLEPTPSRFAYADAMTYFARALGEARSGDAAAADKDVQALAQLVETLKTAKDDYWATEVEVQRLAAAAWVAYARGDHEAALKMMAVAADMEDASDKNALTPGRLVPARELLGDMLLDSGRASEALAAYEGTLTLDPKRFRSIYGAGVAAGQAGDRDKARHYFGALVAMVDQRSARPEIAQARDYLARN